MVESSTCAVCKEMHGDSRRERSEDGGNDGDDDIPCDLLLASGDFSHKGLQW